MILWLKLSLFVPHSLRTADVFTISLIHHTSPAAKRRRRKTWSCQENRKSIECVWWPLTSRLKKYFSLLLIILFIQYIVFKTYVYIVQNCKAQIFWENHLLLSEIIFFNFRKSFYKNYFVFILFYWTWVYLCIANIYFCIVNKKESV